MDLFNNDIGKSCNFLPKDCEVNYYGVIMPKVLADSYFEELLLSIDWKKNCYKTKGCLVWR